MADAADLAAGSTEEVRVPIVGIGASAGGLDAFSRLMAQLPADTGFAFVIVQHSEAKHPSHLSRVLGRSTGMPVSEARDGMPVLANRVYVIPPNSEWTVGARRLRLAARSRLTHRPIDRLLQSLAEECGNEALGVVLSGSGSDGCAGLLAIKQANGITFAQEPGSAKEPSMPLMAIAAGAADVVLPPEAIATELVRIARRPLPGILQSGAGATSGEETDRSAEHFRTVRQILLESFGVDFSQYRETSIRRRILRRLTITNVEDLAAYVRLLRDTTEERAALYRDLLLGVTSFFRDPGSFAALRALVFPALVHERPDDSTIRVWVAGCATGEEAYSVLMELQDFQREAHTDFPVRIFASDISEAAVAQARAGRYSASIADHVAPERLKRYFSKIAGGYQISRELREQFVFSRHNLLEDPPFPRLDLISCRNVLIHLATARRKVIPLLHYALVDHGFLFLASDESTRRPDLFEEVAPREGIYSKRRITRKPYESFGSEGAVQRGSEGQDASLPVTSLDGVGWSEQVKRFLLSRYSPAAVLVDEGLQVIEIWGQPSPALVLTAGRASLELLKLLPDAGLFLEIEKLVKTASQTGTRARAERIPHAKAGRLSELTVEVVPLRDEQQTAYLILFEQLPLQLLQNGKSADRAGSSYTGARRDAQIERLEQQLEEARARLVTLTEAHQASNEERQRIADDALSAHEEFQSLTEELETAKEELQATNEELITLNQELEARNVALASARDLATATVETVRVPLVVVDDELVTKYVNAAFAKSFKTPAAAAQGRDLYALLGLGAPPVELSAQVDQLRNGGKPFDHVEIQHESRETGRRVLLIGGSRIQDLGLILFTIEDVTQQREAEQALQRSEEQRRESDKMETVGRLAGGIAHDFNNLLTVIIGDAELLRDTRRNEHEMSELTQEICETAERAATLTDQLLTFSRRKVLQSKVFDLNPLLGDFESMLQRLLGGQIKIVMRRAAEPCLIEADPAEIGRVVMNLCLNARDAMPAGGVLTVETDHLRIDETSAPEGVGAGTYVRLAVSDTGLGMDAETRRRAFEPFFTTKDASHGAGLGLATVFGIVQRSGGSVSCDSELGRGSRFTVLLPAATGVEDLARSANGELRQAPRGSEVVLLVEDEDAVRSLTKRILERTGYVVLEASNAREGLSALQTHSGHIDLLLSDLLMPEVDGAALAERARSLRPGLKILLVSGYAEASLVQQAKTGGLSFLPKPFTPAELTRKVRQVLDAKTEPALSQTNAAHVSPARGMHEQSS